MYKKYTLTLARHILVVEIGRKLNTVPDHGNELRGLEQQYRSYLRVSFRFALLLP